MPASAVRRHIFDRAGVSFGVTGRINAERVEDAIVALRNLDSR